MRLATRPLKLEGLTESLSPVPFIDNQIGRFDDMTGAHFAGYHATHGRWQPDGDRSSAANAGALWWNEIGTG
jgi:hypothetical protein